MSEPIKIQLGLAAAKPNKEELKRELQEAFATGKIAVFTNSKNDITKKVREWNADDEGDLVAFESTGRTAFVCWEAADYNITYEDA